MDLPDLGKIFSGMSEKKKIKYCAVFYRKFIKANVLNPLLARDGKWISAVITNYNIEAVPVQDKMYAFVEGEKIISNYYNVSLDDRILNLIPYVFVSRIEKETKISQGKLGPIIDGKEHELKDTKIAIYCLLDNFVVSKEKANSKFLKKGTYSFEFPGMPPPIYRIPDEIRVLMS